MDEFGTESLRHTSGNVLLTESRVAQTLKVNRKLKALAGLSFLECTTQASSFAKQSMCVCKKETFLF